MLATRVFEDDRLLTAVDAAPLTRTETCARFVFWSRLGGELDVGAIPGQPDQLWEWMLDYEHRSYRFTPAGCRVADAVTTDWAALWLPSYLPGVA